MSLSVCLLTRNHEACLEQAIGSLRILRAEVVVIDTGSTDGTVALARRLGANVHPFEWRHDFSEGQNAALERSSGDWILWLNPDEELLPASAACIPMLLERSEILAYQVQIESIADPKRPSRGVVTVSPRLFRRRPEVRYFGRLHPYFSPSLETVARDSGLAIRMAPVTLRQHSYLSTPTEEKVRWTIRLLELELADRPGQLPYLVEYGRNLLRLNNPRGHEILGDAARIVQGQADAPTASSPAVASLLEYLLTVSPEQCRGPIGSAAAKELACRWFPKSPPLLWAMAHNAAMARRYREAADLLQSLLQFGKAGGYDPSTPFDPSILAEPALLNLGRCLGQLGEHDQAEACFGKLLADPDFGPKARAEFAASQQRRKG